MVLPELLSDPVRARIYIEILVHGELTAQQLKDKVSVNRSTLSHHLTRFVSDRVFKVRVQETGRPVKHYRINPEFSEELVIEGEDKLSRSKKIAFLRSSAAHLQVVSNLILERAHALETGEFQPSGQSVTFTFSFLSKDKAEQWLQEYEKFQKQFEEKFDRKAQSEEDFAYMAFGGLVPTKSPPKT
jgi:DNA-binding transcriptional ArsR family regulator